jgi:hypothetical protein
LGLLYKEKSKCKTESKLKSSANKSKILSATLPGNDARKALDNPQEQGIIVAPLNMEIWVSICRSKKEKLLLSPTRVPQF